MKATVAVSKAETAQPIRLTSSGEGPEFRVVDNDQVYGSLATLGKVMAHVPRFLRIGLFFVLLRWKACLSILGSLAFFKLAHNAYLGAVLLAGWLEYVSAAILFWIIYLLIRRALT